MRLECVKAPISSYEFMRYLCASLVKQSKIIIDLESITSHIYEFKQKNPDLGYMFEDIEFRTSIDNVSSIDIAESINSLQTFGVIGKLNPKYEKLVIYLTEEEADNILLDCEDKVKQAIKNLALTF